MDLTNVEKWVAVTGAAAPILYGLYKKGVVPMFTYCKTKYAKAKTFISDISDCIKLVNLELTPNHGSSIKDAICRIDHRVYTLEEKNRVFLQHLDVPHIDLNKLGHLQWANRACLKLFNKDFTEVRNFGWLGCINSIDRDIIEEELKDSIRQERSFTGTFKLNDKINVILEATAIFSENGGFNGYLGVLKLS
jgi:hypothetical protein